MNPAALAMLVKGLKEVVDEYGVERARSDAGWLHNILADYSPQTLALNRVVAAVAREGFPDLLRRATTVGESDAVVRQAVFRLVSAQAIEQGVAYDAVTVWAGIRPQKWWTRFPREVFQQNTGDPTEFFGPMPSAGVSRLLLLSVRAGGSTLSSPCRLLMISNQLAFETSGTHEFSCS